MNEKPFFLMGLVFGFSLTTSAVTMDEVRQVGENADRRITLGNLNDLKKQFQHGKNLHDFHLQYRSGSTQPESSQLGKDAYNFAINEYRTALADYFNARLA